MIETPIIITGLVAFVVSAAISAILIPIVRREALRRNFVDLPGGGVNHKAHEKPTAFGGGIAITVAVVLPIILVLLVTYPIG